MQTQEASYFERSCFVSYFEGVFSLLNCSGWMKREIVSIMERLIFQTTINNRFSDQQGELTDMLVWFRLSVAASDISDMSPAFGLELYQECCSCRERPRPKFVMPKSRGNPQQASATLFCSIDRQTPVIFGQKYI